MKTIEKKRPSVDPLRLLRSVAGSGEKPLAQAELARATDISLDTIRAIENNRRALTPQLLEKIRDSIGAQWDSKGQFWHLAYAPELPYSADIYRKFRTKWLKNFWQINIETHVLCRRLIELVIQVEDADYNSLFQRVFAFLDQTRESLHITGARRVFEKTQFEVWPGRNRKTGEIDFIVRKFASLDDEIVQISRGKALVIELLNFSWLARQKGSSQVSSAELQELMQPKAAKDQTNA